MRGEDKVRRSWQLTRSAWQLIRHDKAMLGLALAGIFLASVCPLLFLYLGGYFSPGHHAGGRLSLAVIGTLYLSTLASVFFNVALACAANASFEGRRISAREAIRAAWGKRWRIALWSLVSTAVGALITEIASRLPGGAKLVSWLAGAAWALATIFVVPILAMEDIGTVDTIKRSGSLVKQRWGEGLTGRLAIGAWVVVVTIPLAIVLGIGVALLRQHPETGIAMIGPALIGIVAVGTAAAATQQVFAVALYRYAIGVPTSGFEASDLENPFTTRESA